MNRTASSIWITTALILGLLVLGAPSASARPAASVAGSWQTVVPVSETSYQPSAADPTTGTYTGVGSTVWQGTWAGVTHYAAHGTANLVTGAGSGTLQETFVGRSSDGGTGTIDFTETYVLDDGGHISIRARIVHATGDFAGSKGIVAFDGTEVGVVTGSGSYHGRWHRRG
jgi:hypothetical protein